MAFLAAWRFLTAIPLPGPATGPRELGRSLAYFPLVGLLLGLSLAGADALLSLAFPPLLSSALVVAALALLTGALHLDGFMDTCDALAGGHTPEERLDIMRDPRVGAVGAVGGTALILVKFAALASTPPALRFAALALAPALGRWAMALAVVALPYARSQGRGLPFKEGARAWHLLPATLLAGAAGLALAGPGAAALLLAAGALTLGLGLYLRRQLGGLTGDCYGAINELVEALALALLPLAAASLPLWSIPWKP